MKKTQTKPPFVLTILDGFGLDDFNNEGNAITPETAPNIFQYMNQYPSTKLTAHGRAVGLFEGQTGNSEAGHFNIGAGRVVKQDLYRVSERIADESFFGNKAFAEGVSHIQEHDSDIHVFGLLTDNNSPHARPGHLYALLKYFRDQGVDDRVYLHLFTDGRDSSPHSSLNFLKELRERMTGQSQIATIMGRFYAMDRNKNWGRTQKAYKTLLGFDAEFTANSAEAAIEQAYNREETDEYIQPTVIAEKKQPIAKVSDDDVIYFYNARSDRARQLTKVFSQLDFQEENPSAFEREEVLENIKVVALTDFGPDLDRVISAFGTPDIPNCLAQAVGESRKQLYISETEKYAHVTFFLNGGFPKPINGEDRELIRSDASHTFADNPQMEARQITDKIIDYIREEKYDFICVNLPNADMVGHTGDIEATKDAVSVVDNQVARIIKQVQQKSGTTVITADHGNAEEMRHKDTKEKITEHSDNPVPFIVIDDQLKQKNTQMKSGKLANVAPTILNLMNIKKPKDMTAESLI